MGVSSAYELQPRSRELGEDWRLQTFPHVRERVAYAQQVGRVAEGVGFEKTGGCTVHCHRRGEGLRLHVPAERLEAQQPREDLERWRTEAGDNIDSLAHAGRAVERQADPVAVELLLQQLHGSELDLWDVLGEMASPGHGLASALQEHPEVVDLVKWHARLEEDLGNAVPEQVSVRRNCCLHGRTWVTKGGRWRAVRSAAGIYTNQRGTK
eukprot:1087039-Pleurochrysis_carterae.AAC.1